MGQQVEAEALVAEIAALTEPRRQWYAQLDAGVREAAQALLRGSIDMHLHCDPSPQLRVMDAFEAAEAASAAGMRAIVLKDHLTGMEDSAFLAMAHADVGDDFDVFGSHWLNNQVGGWNVYAVDKAVALQDYFRDNSFVYSTQTPLKQGYDGDGSRVIARFLEVKSGYCVHFASAMALMARTLGIPSRVAEGYLPGATSGGSATGWGVSIASVS